MSPDTDKNVLLRLFIGALFALALLGMSGCGKTYSRDDFKKMVMNKSEAEVKSSLGEPDWVNDSEPIMWTYRHTTFDAQKQNERDAQAVIIFGPDAAGKRTVVEVRFD